MEYSALKEQYRNFEPYFEMHRESINHLFEQLLSQGDTQELNEYLQRTGDQDVHNEIRQKLVYHSTLCFFRSFDLMLAYISLNDKRFHTWSEVTAYYSKFYIIKAICFLLQRGYVTINFDKREKLVDNKNDSNFYFLYNSSGFKTYNSSTSLYKQLRAEPNTNRNYGSHQIWWKLLETVKDINGIDNKFERVVFLLDHNWTNPKQRNQINYSLEYLEGFKELDWFDANLEGHHSWRYKDQRDFTSKEKFFEYVNPEDIDLEDYYTDLRVYLWESLMCYLEIYKDLIGQNSIFRIENIHYLLEIHEINETIPRLSCSMKNMINEIFEQD